MSTRSRDIVAVVDVVPRRWPPPRVLVALGLSLEAARRWSLVRRTLSPAALRRRYAKEHLN